MAGEALPITRKSWRDIFHASGVNLRYLARVRSLVPKTSATLRQLLLVEMTVRVGKNMLWSALRQRKVAKGQDDTDACKNVVADFLNRNDFCED